GDSTGGIPLVPVPVVVPVEVPPVVVPAPVEPVLLDGFGSPEPNGFPISPEHPATARATIKTVVRMVTFPFTAKSLRVAWTSNGASPRRMRRLHPRISSRQRRLSN